MSKKIFFICVAFSLVGLLYFLYNTYNFPAASQRNIVIQSDHASYASKDVIKITLANQSKDPIYFSDHQSNCTVILLQRQIAKNWEEENQCALFRQPILFSLDHNKTTVLELSPLQTGWNKGTYRVVMAVHLKNNKNAYTILSQVFQVK